MKNILIYISIGLAATILFCSYRIYNYSSQQAKLPVAMIFPKVIQGKSIFYVISQGYSEKYKAALNLQMINKVDTQVIIYEYNPANAVLRKISDAPFVRNFFGACTDGNKIFIAGGFDSQWKMTNSVFEFDLKARKWTTRRPMNSTRARFSFERIGDKIYALGGENTKIPCEQNNLISDNWSIIKLKVNQQLEMFSEISASAVIENRIFIFGKKGDEFEIFSSEDNSLIKGPATPVKSENFSVVPFSKRIYVSGGTMEGTMSGLVYLYDFVENSWSTVGKIPFPRYGSGLVYFNGMLLHLGGTVTSQIQPVDEIFIYRPMK